MPGRLVVFGPEETAVPRGASPVEAMTLSEAEAYLESLINHERSPDLRRTRFSLEPARRLLARLGNPEAGLRILHVAGSKGKGSTALLAEALLNEVGASVGVFTSPHLESWAERFRLHGAPVDGAVLAAAVERLRPHVDVLRAEPDAPTFFDALTATALLLFAEARVDVAVLEVGLGGRLDSTNVVSPAVTCITSIELEHVEKLGDTLSAIATEKVGIAKPGVPLVVGALPPEAMQAVVQRAGAVGAPLVRLGRDVEFEVLDEQLTGTRLRLRDGPVDCEIELATPGAHQAGNAALALACVRRLGCPGVEDAALPDVARRAFARARLPARAELVGRRPWLLVDAAHTAASARALSRVLALIDRAETHLVLSVSAGKDLAAICESLVPCADRVTVTRAEPVRSLDPGELAAAVREVASRQGRPVDVRCVADPELAVRSARESLGEQDLLCATGSVYLAGIARRILGAAEDARGR